MIPALAMAAGLARSGWSESDFLVDLRKAQTRGEPSERVEYLDRAIDAWEPADGNELLADAYLLRGEASYWSAELSTATADLGKALSLDPNAARGYLLRGRIALRQGRAGDAVADLREYASLSPDDVEGRLALADAQTRAGLLRDAERSAAAAERLSSADPRAALARARIAAARRDWRSALEAVEAARKAGAREPELQMELGLCDMGLRKPEEALAAYASAAEGYDKGLEDLSRSAARKLDVEDARRDSGRSYFALGRVNEYLGRLDDAASDYRRACERGSAPACKKSASLAASAPRPEPRRAAPVKSDAGDRIYAN